MSRCGIVILAAGGSTRMGAPKQSLLFEGSTLLNRAVNTAIASVCKPVVVVLGAGANTFENDLTDLPVQVVINDRWATGMGTSIRTGVNAIRDYPLDAVMIFLCDQPLVTNHALNRMVKTHFENSKLITSAFYADFLGTPTIFSASLIEELNSLEDEQGGKAIIKRYPHQVTPFPLPEAEFDVDTQADFEKLSAGRQ